MRESVCVCVCEREREKERQREREIGRINVQKKKTNAHTTHFVVRGCSFLPDLLTHQLRKMPETLVLFLSSPPASSISTTATLGAVWKKSDRK